jgi:D-alanyl-D-alanine carboxypeptidase
LVARAGVPWRQVAVNLPAGAGLVVPPQARAGDDEDAAESRPDDVSDDDTNEIAPPPAPVPRTTGVAAAPAPAVPAQQPRVVAMQPPPQNPVAPPKPAPASNLALKPAPKPVNAVAAASPAISPKPRDVAAVAPTAKPQAASSTGEGDVGDAGVPTSMNGAWTIQIGAFADMNQARGQLAAYAEKSMDVLGQAARIIVPFTAVDGHTLYRARFGPFVEREAREVCSRLSQRGQTCFAALASSH